MSNTGSRPRMPRGSEQMHILGKDWRDGYLDDHRPPGYVRVRVRAWWPLERLRDVYIDQPRSIARLWHYYREVGLRELARKVRSRLRETLRDRRFVCVGAGEILEADDDAQPSVGTPIALVAPCHPECVERVCLPQAFVTPIPGELLERLSRPESICLYQAAPPADHADWDAVAGWNRFSGADVDEPAARLLSWARSALQRLDPGAARVLPLPHPSPVAECFGRMPAKRGELTAVLFGLGNYAKTCIIPNIDSRIQVQCIHEIEPTQLGALRADGRAYDTSDTIRPDEDYDVYLIAGYHHTHADLAIRALGSGRWAVVEKPVVTTREQLDRLLAALRGHPHRLYAGFHMRYNPLWPLARADLQLKPGEPVNYHCIVFEIPLKRRHWYNWPNSRSRIVCNGCHWLDHFLFMNDYVAPTRWSLWKARNGDLHTSVELENGATMSMSLTDHGSRRIGVQEHIQLRANGITVRVDNGGRYMSENRYRIIRRRRINKAVVARCMYQTISRRILSGAPGDSMESVQRSSELMLALDELHANA